MDKMTTAQIESIVFNEIGHATYTLKKIEIVNPQQNVAGLIRIENNYYLKQYINF